MTEPAANLLPVKRSDLVKNISLLLSGSVISQALTALALLLTARQLGPDGYGQYTSSIVIATFAAIFFNLGMDMWLLREAGSQPAQVGMLGGSVLGVKAVLGGLWYISLFLLAGKIQFSSFSAEVLRLAALIIWLDSLFSTFQVLFKATLRNQFTSGMVVASDLSWFLITLFLVVRAEQNVIIYLVVRIGVLIISIIAAGTLSWIKFTPWPRLAVIQRIVREIFPYAVSELLILALLRVDILILSVTLGEEAVGLYAPASSLVNALYLVPNAIHGVLLPVMANAFTQDTQRAWRMAGKLVLIQAAVGFLLTLTVFFASPFLVALLGPKYNRSLDILQILSFNIFFHAISFAMVAILIAAKRQVNRAVVQTVATLANVGLNLAVVYTFGIRGVAVVYVVTEIILAAGYTIYVWLLRRNSYLTQTKYNPVV